MLNIKQIREASRTSWRELWDKKLTYGQNIKALIDSFILYPNHSIQSLIVAAYACQHLQLLNRAFILYAAGQSRSGKTFTGELLTNTAGYTGIVPTMAGIRNFIENNIYLKDDEGLQFDVEGNPIESHVLIHCEDMSESQLSQPNFYQFLKVSRDRNNAMVIAGDVSGESKSFSPFCLIAISSCFEPFTYAEKYQELINRCVFIRCERSEEELLQLEDYDFTGLQIEHEKAWTRENCLYYLELRKSIRKHKFFNIPEWEVSKPLILSGIVQGLFTKIEAIELFEQYWTERREIHSRFVNPLHQYCQLAVENWQQNHPNSPHAIQKEFVNKFLNDKQKSGELSINRIPKHRIPQIMSALGFRQCLLRDIAEKQGILINNDKGRIAVYYSEQVEHVIND